MKTSISIFIILIGGLQLMSQSASEVLKYSLSRPFGTARATGISEAVGSLGGDFSSIAINPAGAGLFRKSDLYVSFQAYFDDQQSTLEGFSNQSYTSEKSYFGFSGVGIMFTSTPFASKWKNVNFGVNLIRTANFSKNYFFKGRSPGSITDRFLELSLDPNAQGFIGLDPDLLDDFEAGLAYETGALFDLGTDPNNYIYTTDLIEHPGYLLPKEQILKTRGGLYEVGVSIAGNYDEKLAVGLSLNFPFGKFSSESIYKEYEAANNEVAPFRNLEFQQELSTKISGVQAKIGAIYKPFSFLRFGLAWHTPASLEMEDNFSTSMSYTYFNNRRDTTLTSISPEGSVNYKLIIPMRTVISAAYLNERGFISADVDIIDPRHAKFNLTEESNATEDYDYQEVLNRDIDKQYKLALQYRLGGELAIKYLRLRAGVELLQQPYANTDGYDTGFSFGLGYRGNKYYADLGFKHTASEQGYAPYLTGNSDFDGDGNVDAPTPLVNQKSLQNLVQLTFGVKL